MYYRTWYPMYYRTWYPMHEAFSSLQALLPSGVSVGVGLVVGSVRLYHLQLFECGEGLVIVAVDACTHACPLGGAHRAVGVVKLDSGARHSGQGLAEDRAEEHVGVSGVNLRH